MRLFTIIMIVLSSATHAFAQNKIWSFGLEAGANFSKFGMDASENEYRAGLVGGLFLTYSVVNTFGVTGKILYSEKGSRVGTTEQILKYVEVPLVGRFFLNREGKFRPNIFIGPSFGFLRGAASKVGDHDPVKLREYKNIYNDFDLGLTAGLGLNLLIARHTRILIDGRYTHGLTDISRDDNDVNNETFAVTAGVSFGIGREH